MLPRHRYTIHRCIIASHTDLHVSVEYEWFCSLVKCAKLSLKPPAPVLPCSHGPVSPLTHTPYPRTPMLSCPCTPYAHAHTHTHTHRTSSRRCSAWLSPWGSKWLSRMPWSCRATGRTPSCAPSARTSPHRPRWSVSHNVQYMYIAAHYGAAELHDSHFWMRECGRYLVPTKQRNRCLRSHGYFLV